MKQNVHRASSQKSLSMKAQKSSKVLFVTVYDPVIFELTNDLIYEVFNRQGKVKKVLIFQKSEVTKFFVQFFSVEDSENAKAQLEGTMLHNNYCKMHIFYSNLTTVDLKNKNSQGKDYSSMQTQKNNQIKNNFSFFDNTKTLKKTADDFSLFKNQNNEPFEFSKYKSRTDQNQLERAINVIRHSQELNQELDAKIERDINGILQQKQEESHFSDFERRVSKKVHYEESLKAELINQSLFSRRQSEVITFTCEQKLPLMELYNLFSNYGNISRIVMKNTSYFIQFINVEFAIISKDYLQNIVIGSNVLRLSFGSKSDLVQRNNQYSERITFDDSYHRFNSNKSISINPPSKILHISNFKKEVANVGQLTQFLETVAKVQKVQILLKQDKQMALAKFFSMEDSVKVISQLHNRIFYQRKLQISFTKSKI